MSTPITIAPHLQRALDVMSKDMSVAPEALVNQAVFAWLRINGYVLPGQPAQAAAPVPVVPPPPVVPAVAPVVPSVAPVAPVAAPVSTPTPVPAAAPEPVVAKAPDRAPALARMAEIDADLEKLARPWPAWPPEAPEEEAPEEEEEAEAPADEAPPPEEDEAEAEEPSRDANTGETEVAQEEGEEEEEERPVEDQTLAPVAAAKDEPVEEEEEVEPPAESTIVLKQVPIVLYLQRADEEPIRVDKERFIIGRGPHCDLIIDSPRVSREHVALTRSGIMYFLEDLNSSNGTWFNEERVTKRELESGDVILLGNEAVTFILRGE